MSIFNRDKKMFYMFEQFSMEKVLTKNFSKKRFLMQKLFQEKKNRHKEFNFDDTENKFWN